MTTIARDLAVSFELDAAHEAHEPPEARGIPRDGVRLLVSLDESEPIDTRFTELAELLEPGDLLVVNTSATIPAALDGRLPSGEPIAVHLSGVLPGGLWLVEPRRPFEGSTAPLHLDHAVDIELLHGGATRLLAPFADSQRLWVATIDVGLAVARYLGEHGRPIRYRHVRADWPLAAYQTVFAREPGSAEMASASRPFTPRLVTDLVSRGIVIAPLLLHTGVSSLEGAETPYPERYRVTPSTAALVNATRAAGGRVVAAGTTVVRALATVTDGPGRVHPGHGWTDVVVTPSTPVRSIDGLLTGWHVPKSSPIIMPKAIASRGALARAYEAALDRGYLWHEFGDSHLILGDRSAA